MMEMTIDKDYFMEQIKMKKRIIDCHTEDSIHEDIPYGISFKVPETHLCEAQSAAKALGYITVFDYGTCDTEYDECMVRYINVIFIPYPPFMHA